MSREWRPQTISGHAFLSDRQSAALVYEDGTIDWLCMPRFDSDACLAALLGDGGNGAWWIGPTADVTHRSRCYAGDTLILESLVETGHGAARIIDFMPVLRGEAPDVVRIVEGVWGEIEMVSHLSLRFDNGRTHPRIIERSEHELVALAGADAVVLRCDVPIASADGGFTSRFGIVAGERRSFALTWFPSHKPVPRPIEPKTALGEARDYWTDWSSRTDYDGVAAAEVRRSLLVINGLIHQPTGGMVAAATTSLPEVNHGSSNWDYRHCWLRDAAFTLLVLIRTGHGEEARAWIDWLRRAIAGEPIELQPLYRVDGRRHLLEWEAEWLAGFGGAQPVRFGNAAAIQCQLDIYGEVIDALAIASRHELIEDAAELATELASKLESIWEQPDAGIWESRAEPRHHVYSKAMCWVAFDRTAALVEPSDAKAARHWRDCARAVRASIDRNGVCSGDGRFKRAYGDEEIDTALLRLPLTGFVEANDPRMRATVAAIEATLLRDGLLYRFRNDRSAEGADAAEGAFLAAGYWLADVYAMQGRLEEARRLFDRLLRAANDLGLFSEETLPGSGAWGNLPQALSHVAMINSALTLSAEGAPPRLS